MIKRHHGLIRAEEDEIAEAKHILSCSGGLFASEQLVSRQLTTIVDRTSSILTLSTVVLTITGFSGPTIAKASLLAAIALGCGLCFTLSSLATALLGSLRVRWATQFFLDAKQARQAHDAQIELAHTDSTTISEPSAEKEILDLATVVRMIKFRDSKYFLFKIELTLLVSGLAAYVVAFLDFVASVAPTPPNTSSGV